MLNTQVFELACHFQILASLLGSYVSLAEFLSLGLSSSNVKRDNNIIQLKELLWGLYKIMHDRETFVEYYYTIPTAAAPTTYTIEWMICSRAAQNHGWWWREGTAVVEWLKHPTCHPKSRVLVQDNAEIKNVLTNKSHGANYIKHTLPLTSWVTLGTSSTLSELWSRHEDTNAYFPGMLEWAIWDNACEIMHCKPLTPLQM